MSVAEQLQQLPPVGSGRADAVPDRFAAALGDRTATWTYVHVGGFMGVSYVVPAMPSVAKDQLSALR